MKKTGMNWNGSWLISNEKEMEPVLLTFEGAGEYKTFEPSLSETFIFVLEGELGVKLRRDGLCGKSRTVDLLSSDKTTSIKESSQKTNKSIDCCNAIIFVI